MRNQERRLSVEQVEHRRDKGFVGPLTLCSPEHMTEIREKVRSAIERPGTVPPPPRRRAARDACRSC